MSKNFYILSLKFARTVFRECHNSFEENIALLTNIARKWVGSCSMVQFDIVKLYDLKLIRFTKR